MKHNLSQFQNKKVKVIDMEDDVYIGNVVLFTPAKDNDSEEDAIAISSGIWLDEGEIKSIEVVED